MTGWFQHRILTMSHRNGIACGQHLAKGVVALHLSQSNEQDQCAELFAEGCSLLFENQMKKDTMQQERLAVHPLLEDPPRSCSSPCYRSLMQCYITPEGADSHSVTHLWHIHRSNFEIRSPNSCIWYHTRHSRPNSAEAVGFVCVFSGLCLLNMAMMVCQHIELTGIGMPS